MGKELLSYLRSATVSHCLFAPIHRLAPVLSRLLPVFYRLFPALYRPSPVPFRLFRTLYRFPPALCYRVLPYFRYPPSYRLLRRVPVFSRALKHFRLGQPPRHYCLAPPAL